MDPKKDNSTIERKVRLRKRFLMELDPKNTVVMETHGGYGALFQKCYSNFAEGAVFEKDQGKASSLALQRPTWAVYMCDCEKAIAAGVGSHLEVTFLDVDPYGEPWNVLDSFFASKRTFSPKMALVVNDGLRQKLRMNGGWAVRSLERIVQERGNAGLYKTYLEVCQQLVAEKAAIAGYRLTKWAGYYCGHGDQMTHYGAMLER